MSQQSENLHLFFEAKIRVNSDSAELILPDQFEAHTLLRRKVKILEPKIRLVALFAKTPIPETLYNRLVLISVAQLPPTSLLFQSSSREHSRATLAPVLTTTWIEKPHDANASDVRLHLTDTAYVAFGRQTPIRSLNISLKTFPTVPSDVNAELDLVFHFHLA